MISSRLLVGGYYVVYGSMHSPGDLARQVFETLNRSVASGTSDYKTCEPKNAPAKYKKAVDDVENH